jgi:hypothetical protein
MKSPRVEFTKLSFLSDYTIKTVERTFSLNKKYETIKLLSIPTQVIIKRMT